MRVIRPTVMRLFESIVEQAAQVDGEVRIGAMTWYQGNPSMPDAAAAERGLVRVHGPQDRTSSLPREECSRERFVLRRNFAVFGEARFRTDSLVAAEIFGR